MLTADSRQLYAYLELLALLSDKSVLRSPERSPHSYQATPAQ
jgi:hypothetical protein